MLSSWITYFTCLDDYSASGICLIYCMFVILSICPEDKYMYFCLAKLCMNFFLNLFVIWTRDTVIVCVCTFYAWLESWVSGGDGTAEHLALQLLLSNWKLGPLIRMIYLLLQWRRSVPNRLFFSMCESDTMFHMSDLHRFVSKGDSAYLLFQDLPDMSLI